MAVELASSVAGLIGLAGLFVQSASSLYVFCRSVSKVHVEIESVVDEAEALQTTLHKLEQLLRQSNPQLQRASKVFTWLEDEIRSCTACVEAWIMAIKELQPQDGKRVRNLVNRLKSAADCNMFLEIRTKLSSSRSQLRIFIELLGLELGFRNDQRTAELSAGLSGLTAKLLSSYTSTAEKLDSLHEGMHNVASLQSLNQTTSAELLNSTGQIIHKLAAVEQLQTTFQGDSLRQAEKLDHLLSAIQSSLLESMKRVPDRRYRKDSSQLPHSSRRKLLIPKSAKGGARRYPVPTQMDSSLKTNNAGAITHTYRLINTAVLAKYIGGRQKLSLVAVPDEEFENATMETKLRMLRQLQGLRLLVWLLRGPNYHPFRRAGVSSTTTSNITWNGSLASFWSIRDRRHWSSFFIESNPSHRYRRPRRLSPSIVTQSYSDYLERALNLKLPDKDRGVQTRTALSPAFVAIFARFLRKLSLFRLQSGHRFVMKRQIDIERELFSVSQLIQWLVKLQQSLSDVVSIEKLAATIELDRKVEEAGVLLAEMINYKFLSDTLSKIS